MPQFAPSLRGRYQTLFAVDFQKHRLTLIYFIELVSPVLLKCLRNVFVEVNERRDSENVLKIDVEPHAFQHGYSDKVRMRECLMCHVFEKFLCRGWRAKFFTNVERTTKRNCVVFEITGDCVSSPHVVALCANSPKKLILENGNLEIARVIEGSIRSLWRKGLKYVKPVDSKSFVFKFHGDPWKVSKPCNALIESRNLILNIFKRLHEMGYYYYTSGHPGSSVVATDTIYFIKTSVDVDPKPLGHTFALGLLGASKIYLVNTQPEIKDIVARWIDIVWRGCDWFDHVDENCYVFRLIGTAWRATGEKGMIARYLLLRLFEELKLVGYRLHAALNLMHNIADVTTFILTKSEPSAIACLSVSFNRSNEVRFVNTQEEVVNEVRKKMLQIWPNVAYDDEDDCYHLADNYMGFPQLHLGEKFVHCIGVLLIILEKMEAMGCHHVASADLSSRHYSSDDATYPVDLHTWIFETTPAVSNQPEAEGASGWSHEKSDLTHEKSGWPYEKA